MNKDYYVNVQELMMKQLPRPTPKKEYSLPLISISVGLWSHITWV